MRTYPGSNGRLGWPSSIDSAEAAGALLKECLFLFNFYWIHYFYLNFYSKRTINVRLSQAVSAMECFQRSRRAISSTWMPERKSSCTNEALYLTKIKGKCVNAETLPSISGPWFLVLRCGFASTMWTGYVKSVSEQYYSVRISGYPGKVLPNVIIKCDFLSVCAEAINLLCGYPCDPSSPNFSQWYENYIHLIFILCEWCYQSSVLFGVIQHSICPSHCGQIAFH
jgi:hypothetical protein